MKRGNILLFLLILGFSLGDELGFKESISNTEINRRRSATGSKFVAQAALAQQQQQQANAGNSISRASGSPTYDLNTIALSSNRQSKTTVPPFKPIPPAHEHPMIIKSNMTKFQNVPQPSLVGMAKIPEFNSMPPSMKLPQMDATKILMKKSSEKVSGNNFIGSLPNSQNEIAGALGPLNVNAIQAILANANISEAALDNLIRKKTITTTTTTTTTPRPPTKHSSTNNIGKVMNAPKEYYPVGYDKNFDDNFTSKVELPQTSFRCEDQKHFPGLYADEDLNCMVFHVCALTDQGLIRKSFLCGQSTLFDQSILKCNFWFFVNCKNSKNLFDSNYAISKSYQLMKALTFFSTYKKEAQAQLSKSDKD